MGHEVNISAKLLCHRRKVGRADIWSASHGRYQICAVFNEKIKNRRGGVSETMVRPS